MNEKDDKKKEEEAEAFRGWMELLDVQPTIKQLIHVNHEAIEDEVARTMRRLGSADEATREALESMGQALMKKFLHAPITYLKEGNRADHSRRIVTVQKVFDLDGHCARRSARPKGPRQGREGLAPCPGAALSGAPS